MPKPDLPTGCLAPALILAAALAGAALGTAALVVFAAPLAVVTVAWFAPPVAAAAWLVQRAVAAARRGGDPGEVARARVSVRFLVIFLTAALAAFAAAGVAAWCGAPVWAVPVIGGVPLVVLAVAAVPVLMAFAEEVRRATPSPEWRAARSPRPDPPAPPAPPPTAPAGPTPYPAVPADPSVPGRDLARRLPPVPPVSGCGCAAVLVVAGLWNLAVGSAVGHAAGRAANGDVEWGLVVFLVPFALIGLGLIALVVVTAAGVVVRTLAGTVVLEVDAHPLAAGGTARGRVSQARGFPLARVAAELIAVEETVYVAGTAETTTEHVAARVPAAADGDRLPLDFAVTVPADAMHSFAAGHNQVAWRFRVTARVLGVLPYEETFPAVVVPGGS